MDKVEREALMGEVSLSDGLSPMERWERARGDGGLGRRVFDRLTDAQRPETLVEIARSMGFPKGLFVRWFATEQRELLDAAEKVMGIEVGHAVRGMVDEATQETVGLAKFKTDRYLRLAELMNPERYARRQEVKHSGLVPLLVIEVAGIVGVGGAVIEHELKGLPAAVVEEEGII